LLLLSRGRTYGTSYVKVDAAVQTETYFPLPCISLAANMRGFADVIYVRLAVPPCLYGNFSSTIVPRIICTSRRCVVQSVQNSAFTEGQFDITLLLFATFCRQRDAQDHDTV
jgi:hypothetical protein